MKTKKIELDVDSIGEQGSSLTKEEEKVISNYIHLKKIKKLKHPSKKKISV